MKWTYETCESEAKKYRTLGEFRKSGAYRVSRLQGWLYKYTWLEDGRVKRTKWTYETCLEAARECGFKKDFCRRYYQAYRKALDMGWIKEYTWFKRPQPGNLKWTFEACKLSAAGCKNKNALRLKERGAYEAARRNGWLKLLFE